MRTPPVRMLLQSPNKAHSLVQTIFSPLHGLFRKRGDWYWYTFFFSLYFPVANVKIFSHFFGKLTTIFEIESLFRVDLVTTFRDYLVPAFRDYLVTTFRKWFTTLWHKMITHEKLFWNNDFWKKTRISRVIPWKHLYPRHQNDYMQLFLFGVINLLKVTFTITVTCLNP